MILLPTVLLTLSYYLSFYVASVTIKGSGGVSYEISKVDASSLAFSVSGPITTGTLLQ